jgi:hypothetical protein
MANLRELRAKRTRASNVVRSNIAWMLSEPAKWAITGESVGPDFVGLPSWWPFWSDVLKDNAREAVRAARKLEAAEGVR